MKLPCCFFLGHSSPCSPTPKLPVPRLPSPPTALAWETGRAKTKVCWGIVGVTPRIADGRDNRNGVAEQSPSPSTLSSPPPVPSTAIDPCGSVGGQDNKRSCARCRSPHSSCSFKSAKHVVQGEEDGGRGSLRYFHANRTHRLWQVMSWKMRTLNRHHRHQRSVAEQDAKKVLNGDSAVHIQEARLMEKRGAAEPPNICRQLLTKRKHTIELPEEAVLVTRTTHTACPSCAPPRSTPANAPYLQQLARFYSVRSRDRGILLSNYHKLFSYDTSILIRVYFQVVCLGQCQSDRKSKEIGIWTYRKIP